MHLKRSFQTLTMALVAGLAAVALVACGGASSGDVTTPTLTSTADSGVFTTSDFGASDGATVADDRPQGPPEEALAACDGLSAEATCSFASPLDGAAVDGTCRARRDDPSQYVCFPDDWEGRGGPGRDRNGPSEEALAACQGTEAGTACSFESRLGTLDGTCSEGLGESGQVACRPEWAPGEGPQGPGGGEGHGPGQRHQQAAAACEGLLAEATCSFEGPLGTVNGSCRTGRDGSTLACAPADWPAH